MWGFWYLGRVWVGVYQREDGFGLGRHRFLVGDRRALAVWGFWYLGRVWVGVYQR